MCYLFYLGIDPEKLVTEYDSLVKEGIILNDCYVYGDRFIRYFGYDKKVKKVELNDAGYDKYIACFKHGDQQHFVVVDRNNKVLYNSYYKSICLASGVMTEKRVLV